MKAMPYGSFKSQRGGEAPTSKADLEAALLAYSGPVEVVQPECSMRKDMCKSRWVKLGWKAICKEVNMVEVAKQIVYGGKKG